MVGIAGRSRACGNCRKRHIRCDETRPTCKRCTKANLDCDGYRDLTVIQYNGCSRVQKHSASLPPSSRKDIFTQAVNFMGTLPLHSIALIEDDVFINYTLAHLLKGSESLDPSTKFVDRKLADQCFLALATSYFGHEHREHSIVERGLRRYGTALSELHRALTDMKRCTSYDVLESVILMAFFEFLMSNNKDGWIAHALGMERLFELRGPEAFRTLPERAVFQASRTCIIFASLVLRKPTILSQAQWKTVPWELDPMQKDSMNYLIDILADCPHISALKCQVLSVTTNAERETLIQELTSQVNSHLEQLRFWKDAWDTTEAHSCYEVPAPSNTPTRLVSADTTERAWETVWSFETLNHANAVTMFHATCILLLRMLHVVEDDSALSTTLDRAQEEYLAGIQICRTVDYHLHKMREGAGSLFLLFPLRMAWEALGQVEPAIGAWLQDVLKKIETGVAGRWALAGYLLNINTPHEIRQ